MHGNGTLGMALCLLSAVLKVAFINGCFCLLLLKCNAFDDFELGQYAKDNGLFLFILKLFTAK